MQRTATCLTAIFVLLPLAGCGQPPAKSVAVDQPKQGGAGGEQKPTADKAAATVQLIIDYGDGVRKTFGDLPWHDKMTVRGVMDEAQQHTHGIMYVAHGKGEEAMLTKLDDLENELGKNAKDWLFYVNDKQADKSFDAWEVRPGDVILWKFGVYE